MSTKWSNRYRLSGSLVTLSPLHMGTGLTVNHPWIIDETNRRPAEINAVATDYQGRDYIPGSAIKGVLRQWSRGHLAHSAVSQLFGEQERGGKVEFADAFLNSAVLPELGGDRYWRPERATCVLPTVAIDPVTRTAAAKRLAFHEFVPPGVSFRLEVTAQDLLSAEVELLCQLFNAFNQSPPARLGGGSADGWGEVTWQPANLEMMEGQDVSRWLAGQLQGETKPWTSALRQLAAIPAPTFTSTGARQELCIHLDLDFDAHFAINDPSRVREKGPEHPRIAPIREAKKGGEVVLLASSFRGVLRSQAARILHTLLPHRPLNRAADLPAAASLAGVTNPLHCLFGQPGWRSPLEIPDFRLARSTQEVRQEFLAIDRFQGGGVDRLKFNAVSAWQPSFQGTLRVDLDRLRKVDPTGGCLGLLLFLLRDLQEGDLRFGFGSAKGYGSCSVRMKLCCARSPFPGLLAEGTSSDPSALISPDEAIPAFLAVLGATA